MERTITGMQSKLSQVESEVGRMGTLLTGLEASQADKFHSMKTEIAKLEHKFQEGQISMADQHKKFLDTSFIQTKTVLQNQIENQLSYTREQIIESTKKFDPRLMLVEKRLESVVEEINSKLLESSEMLLKEQKERDEKEKSFDSFGAVLQENAREVLAKAQKAVSECEQSVRTCKEALKTDDIMETMESVIQMKKETDETSKELISRVAEVEAKLSSIEHAYQIAI
ncbi:hypothetical protein ADUPG1_007051, partial [Aduncisulcus paluster]